MWSSWLGVGRVLCQSFKSKVGIYPCSPTTTWVSNVVACVCLDIIYIDIIVPFSLLLTLLLYVAAKCSLAVLKMVIRKCLYSQSHKNKRE